MCYNLRVNLLRKTEVPILSFRRCAITPSLNIIIYEHTQLKETVAPMSSMLNIFSDLPFTTTLRPIIVRCFDTMTLDDPERPIRTLAENMHFMESTEKLANFGNRFSVCLENCPIR